MVDIDFLTRSYFYFDKPVPYKLRNNKQILINPIHLVDSEIFLSSVNVLQIDKNSMPSVEIIQMSYLQFLCQCLLMEIGDAEVDKKAQYYQSSLFNLLYLCLNIKRPSVIINDDGKYCIQDDDNLDIIITPKDFDDIKKIILYQNIYGYDDTYINPEAKKAMDEVDALKNQEYANISVERKIAIISAHTGMTKKEQLEMTFRSHSILFKEVTDEVEFTTTRNAVLIGGKTKNFEHWIFKKKKNKYKDYFVSDKKYNESMGGDGNIVTSNSDIASSYINQFNNFKK